MGAMMQWMTAPLRRRRREERPRSESWRIAVPESLEGRALLSSADPITGPATPPIPIDVSYPFPGPIWSVPSSSGGSDHSADLSLSDVQKQNVAKLVDALSVLKTGVAPTPDQLAAVESALSAVLGNRLTVYQIKGLVNDSATLLAAGENASPQQVAGVQTQWKAVLAAAKIPISELQADTAYAFSLEHPVTGGPSSGSRGGGAGGTQAGATNSTGSTTSQGGSSISPDHAPSASGSTSGGTTTTHAVVPSTPVGTMGSQGEEKTIHVAMPATSSTTSTVSPSLSVSPFTSGVSGKALGGQGNAGVTLQGATGSPDGASNVPVPGPISVANSIPARGPGFTRNGRQRRVGTHQVLHANVLHGQHVVKHASHRGKPVVHNGAHGH